MSNQNTTSSTSTPRPTRIKTTLRPNLWAVQKRESGGRWGLMRDSQGVFVFTTRKIARNIVREIGNTNPDDRVRVVKLVPNKK